MTKKQKIIIIVQPMAKVDNWMKKGEKKQETSSRDCQQAVLVDTPQVNQNQKSATLIQNFQNQSNQTNFVQSALSFLQSQQPQPINNIVGTQRLVVQQVTNKNLVKYKQLKLTAWGFKGTVTQWHTLCEQCGRKLTFKKSVSNRRGAVCKGIHNRRLINI